MMKINPIQKTLKRLMGCCLSAVAVGMATLPALSQSNGPATAPVRANLSLAKPAFMEGEPLVLNYEVINASKQDGQFVLGEYQKQWLTLRLEDGNGTPVPAMAGPKWINPRVNGMTVSGDVLLSANTSRKGSLLLNRWFAPLAPGIYTLKITMRLPYALGELADTDLFARARNKDSVLSKQVTLSVTVTEADPRAMKKTAAALKETILTESQLLDQYQGNESQWADALNALFTLPPAVAHSIRRSLITDPRLSARGLEAIYNHLATYGSASVADFLAEATWRYRHPGARNALLIMHAFFADETVKARIQKMFADHKDTMTGMLVNLG